MAKENEDMNVATIIDENKEGEKLIKRARLEGMIAYQKHLIENLKKENAKLTQQLNAL